MATDTKRDTAAESNSVTQCAEPRLSLAASPIMIGNRTLATRFVLAPLAGYTHLAFRLVLRRIGGLGLATTDLVLASMLWSGRRKSLELVQTCPEDRPLSVQIFGGETKDLIKAARWLQDQGYEGIDINMGCPMAKVTGSGGGARLMCNVKGAVGMVGRVIDAVSVPVTVKMRLGWDQSSLAAPELAAALEDIGVAAITVHGRTRAQGFQGNVNRDGIRQTVNAVRSMPIIANGDVRTPADALSMMEETGCAAVAIGRGAMLDPWIFRRIQRLACGSTESFEPSPDEQFDFLTTHFTLMAQQHGEYACLMIRKFAAWYGAQHLESPKTLKTACGGWSRLRTSMRLWTRSGFGTANVHAKSRRHLSRFRMAPSSTGSSCWIVVTATGLAPEVYRLMRY